MPSSLEIPPAYRALFDAAGPVIRYRLVRDVLGHDESWIETAHLGLELARLPEVEALIAAQDMDGSWNGLLCRSAKQGGKITTETALLRLCELGLESGDAVRNCIEKALVPTIFHAELIWELESFAPDESSRNAVRTVARDKALRLVTRATRELDEVLKPQIETILAEWSLFLSGGSHHLPPTADGYAAVCWYRWSDDDFLRVRALATKLMAFLEGATNAPSNVPAFYAPHVLRLFDKWEYLTRPPLLFHELELAARLGVARDLPVTRWLLEELESRQDADGRFRFDLAEPVEESWYFPLERNDSQDHSVEWTFRASHIYRLLEYDL